MVRWRLTECKVLDNVHPEAIGGSNHCQKRYENHFPNRVGPRMPRVHSSLQPSFIGMKQAHYTWDGLGAVNLKDRHAHQDAHIKRTAVTLTCWVLYKRCFAPSLLKRVGRLFGRVGRLFGRVGRVTLNVIPQP